MPVMQSERDSGASVLIKNVSGSDYPVAEIGGVVVANENTIDLMDYYDNWNAAIYLVTKENPSQLWSDLQAGDIELVSWARPVPNFGGPG